MGPTRITSRRRISPLKFRLWATSLMIALFASVLWMPSAVAQDNRVFRPPTSTGPAVGERIPAFRAPDQNGQMQDFDSIKGPNGAAIYFMRSFDW